MLVRAATRDDHDAVLDLMHYLNPDDPPIPDSASPTVFAEILESHSFSIIVVEKYNTIVGTCYLNRIPNLTRCASPYAIIENVVVHPDYRRQGIGNAVMSYALDLAKNAGCYKAMLLTGRNPNVHEFYTACGLQSGAKTAFVVRWDVQQPA